MSRRKKVIVVTGGPGGGKTTALDLFQRELKSAVKIVPEAATLLFGHGLDRESRTAVSLDEKLQRVWERHPNFHFIPTELSFMRKINHGLEAIAGVLRRMQS